MARPASDSNRRRRERVRLPNPRAGPAAAATGHDVTGRSPDGGSNDASQAANSFARHSTERAIHRRGVGMPLQPSLRRRLEHGLGRDLGHVRVHDDSTAHGATAALGARAFTHRHHIWLGRGESASDVPLMAHEATHVVQQGAAPVSEGAQEAVASGAGFAALRPALAAPPPPPAQPVARPTVQPLLGAIGDFVNDYARHIPGYTLFTVIIGYNPLISERVQRNATNLLEGLMGLVPFGTHIFDKLREHGIIQRAFDWVEGELNRLDLSLSRVERTLEDAWEDISVTSGFSYNLGVLERHFGRLLSDVEDFALSLVDQLLAWIKEVALDLAERLLADNQAWDLIKKVLHRDPLRDERVDASTVEILEDFLRLIGKEQELEQMRARGTLEETAAWIDTQLGTFFSLLGELGGLFTSAWEAIQPRNLPELPQNLQSLATRAFDLLGDLWEFAVTVALKVLELIKNALLSWLKSFATDIPGYHLLTVILRKDPFTQEEVPRTPTNLIRGFMSLMPGGERQFQEMQETGVIPRAAQRITTLMSQLGISWPFIRDLFLGIWDSLSIDDLIDPIGAFQRIVDRFGEPIGRLFTFVVEVIKVVLELILKLMNFPSDILGRIIANAMAAIEDIRRDPIAFIKNMLSAVKLGFGKFFDNILQHLLSGVTDWLFGQVRKAGIEPPTEITLESMLDLVLQILGLTADRLWGKLAERIGQERVDQIRGAIDRLVGIWNFVRDVQERGIAAIWEYIESQITGLFDMVLEKARDWIVVRVVERVTAKIISMLDPTGIMAVVNSFIAFFNAVQSAIEYFREMLMIVDDYVSTLAAVARGDIEPGAVKMEQGLANSIPVAIGFLANQVGLGNLADKLQEIIGGIRALVDRALDWLMDRVMQVGQAILRTLGVGGAASEEDDTETGAAGSVDERWTQGMTAVRTVAQQARRDSLGSREINQRLEPIKTQYGFRELTAAQRDGETRIHAVLNPEDWVDVEDETEAHSEESLWESVAAQVTTSGPPGVSLSPSSASNLQTVLEHFIDNSSATAARKNTVRGLIQQRIRSAQDSGDPHQIYVLLAQAGGIVNDLYRNAPAAQKPNLQVHHEQGVAEFPETFVETRTQRIYVSRAIRAQARTRINQIQGLSAGEREERYQELVRQIKEQIFDEQQTAMEAPLDEIDLIAYPRRVHAEIHRRRDDE